MQVVSSHMQVIGVYLKRSCEEVAIVENTEKNSHCTSTLGCETNTIVDKHLIHKMSTDQ